MFVHSGHLWVLPGTTKIRIPENHLMLEGRKADDQTVYADGEEVTLIFTITNTDVTATDYFFLALLGPDDLTFSYWNPADWLPAGESIEFSVNVKLSAADADADSVVHLKFYMHGQRYLHKRGDHWMESEALTFGYPLDPTLTAPQEPEEEAAVELVVSKVADDGDGLI